MKGKKRLIVSGLCLLAMLLATPVWADDEETALAKKTQNPVADLITVPIQNNTNFRYGPHNQTQNVCNVQPVIPIKLNDCYNLITRTIVPFIHQPWPDTRNGIGDILFSAFLSPRGEGKWIWGAGPVVSLPTGSPKYLLSSGQWAAGPTGVVVFMDGPWVAGCLANNIWSFAGDSNRRPVNQMTLQPFVNYNLGHGWFINSVPLITANWLAPNKRDVWTLPVGGGGGRLIKFGRLPVSFQLQAYKNVKEPHVLGPDWTLRSQITFIF
jgi:hypothetical protein